MPSTTTFSKVADRTKRHTEDSRNNRTPTLFKYMREAFLKRILIATFPCLNMEREAKLHSFKLLFKFLTTQMFVFIISSKVSYIYSKSFIYKSFENYCSLSKVELLLMNYFMCSYVGKYSH